MYGHPTRREEHVKGPPPSYTTPPTSEALHPRNLQKLQSLQIDTLESRSTSFTAGLPGQLQQRGSRRYANTPHPPSPHPSPHHPQSKCIRDHYDLNLSNVGCSHVEVMITFNARGNSNSFW